MQPTQPQNLPPKPDNPSTPYQPLSSPTPFPAQPPSPESMGSPSTPPYVNDAPLSPQPPTALQYPVTPSPQPPLAPPNMQQKSNKTIWIIVGVSIFSVLLVGSLILAITLLNFRNTPNGGSAGDSAKNVFSSALPSAKLELVDYSNDTANFSMKMPKGWESPGGSSESDDTSVMLFGPIERGQSGSSVGSGTKFVSVRYTHETNAARYSTTQAEYFTNVKEQRAREVRDAARYNTEQSKQTKTLESESQITVGKYPAYKSVVRTKGTYLDKPVDTTNTKVNVYIDPLTVYELEFDGPTDYKGLINSVDGMLSSFKPLR